MALHKRLQGEVIHLTGCHTDKRGYLPRRAKCHVLKRLYLIDEARRKRQTDGIVYVISPLEVIDMMRRYHVTLISVDNTKNPS